MIRVLGLRYTPELPFILLQGLYQSPSMWSGPGHTSLIIRQLFCHQFVWTKPLAKASPAIFVALYSPPAGISERKSVP